MPKKISIGMPVYNGQDFIREALDSLLAQTFTDFELIISDNASTDDTEAICREYAARDHRIRYVRQCENRGVIANFRFVLDEADGEYFMWAAADDVWEKEWISVLYPIAQKHRCLAYGRIRTIDGNGVDLRHAANGRRFDFSGPVFWRRLKYFVSPAFLGKANPIYGIVPRAVLTEDICDVFDIGSTGTDMLALYKLLSTTDIRSGDRVHLLKRLHSGCYGGGVSVGDSSNRNYLRSALVMMIGTSISLKRQLTDYGAISTAMERLAQVLLSPMVLSLNWVSIVFQRMSRR